MQTRNAASVLPVPVGAAISVSRPRAIAGQPCACASVGPSGNRRSNQAPTAGWKEASASMPAASVASAGGESQTKAAAAPDGALLGLDLGLEHEHVLLAWRGLADARERGATRRGARETCDGHLGSWREVDDYGGRGGVRRPRAVVELG